MKQIDKMSRIKEYYLNNIEDFNEIEHIDYEQYNNDIQQYQQEINKQIDFSQDDEYLFI